MLTKRDTSGRIGFLHFEARRGAQLPGRRAAGINAILVGAGYNYRLVPEDKARVTGLEGNASETCKCK